MGYNLIITNDLIVCKTSSFCILTTFIVLRGLILLQVKVSDGKTKGRISEGFKT
jgi:hypothetical protein